MNRMLYLYIHSKLWYISIYSGIYYYCQNSRKLITLVIFLIEQDLKLLIQFWEYKEYSAVKKKKKKTRILKCDTVLLTKVEIFFKFHKI